MTDDDLAHVGDAALAVAIGRRSRDALAEARHRQGELTGAGVAPS